jgi:hypothetical protein
MFEDDVKLAGVIDIVSGVFLAVILGLMAIYNPLPELRTVIACLAIFGVLNIVVGILVLLRVAHAALVGIVFFTALAIFGLLGSMVGTLTKGRKGSGAVLIAWGGYAAYRHYKAWTELRRRRR